MNISDKAVLVSLSMGIPGNAREDTEITQTTISQRSMSPESGKWLKKLYPPDKLKPLVQYTGMIRTWHYDHTLVYDKGRQLLPMMARADYVDEMRKFKAGYEMRRDDLVAQYDELVAWAKQAHNGSFDPKLYRGADDFAAKFYFTLAFDPVPSSGHFNTEIATLLGDEAAAVDHRVQMAACRAQADLWNRLREPVQHMVDRLGEQDPTFRDSLVENVEKIVDLIPALNLTGDVELEKFRLQVKKTLTFFAPQELRDSEKVRKAVATEAAEILRRMEGITALQMVG